MDPFSAWVVALPLSHESKDNNHIAKQHCLSLIKLMHHRPNVIPIHAHCLKGEMHVHTIKGKLICKPHASRARTKPLIDSQA